MEKPEPMNATEAAHWMIDHPLDPVVCHDLLGNRIEFRYMGGQFWKMINGEAWYHCAPLDYSLSANYYVQKQYDDWWNQETTLEDILREEIRVLFGLKNPPPLSQDDLAMCRAVTEWVEQKLRESKA